MPDSDNQDDFGSSHQTVHLQQIADKDPITEIELKNAIRKDKHSLRMSVAVPFVRAFTAINLVIIFALIGLGWVEWNAAYEGKQIPRLITSEVIMTIIGATTVQLGIVMVAISKSVFPAAGTDES